MYRVIQVRGGKGLMMAANNKEEMMYRVLNAHTQRPDADSGRPSTPAIEPQQARAAAVELTERGHIYVDSIEDAREVLAVLPRVADDPHNYRVTDLGDRVEVRRRELPEHRTQRPDNPTGA